MAVRPFRKRTAAAASKAAEDAANNTNNNDCGFLYCHAILKFRLIGYFLVVIMVTVNLTDTILQLRLTDTVLLSRHYRNTDTPTTTTSAEQQVDELVNERVIESLVNKRVEEILKNRKLEASSTTTVGGNNSNELPSCVELMSRPNSPYKDGEVLTRPTTPVRWKLRPDGSRELQLTDVCVLKRYSHAETQQCLANQHMLVIGDSLSRFLYLSLAYFLEHGSYPARFGRGGHGGNPCHHRDATGQPICSTEQQPSIVIMNEFLSQTNKDQYEGFHRALGDVSGQFHGHLQCHCWKNYSLPSDWTENMHHVSGQNTRLTFYREHGFGAQPKNITGRPFSDCAQQGTCRRGDAEAADLAPRLTTRDFEMNAPLEDLIASGALAANLPAPVDVFIYNRGIWGPLRPPRSNVLLPLLHQLVENTASTNKHTGRCFFRSTMFQATGSDLEEQNGAIKDRSILRRKVLEQGCGYLDFHYLTREFGDMTGVNSAPKQDNGQIWSGVQEHQEIYVDKMHFQPWVYEELNNLLLNVLCNSGNGGGSGDSATA